MNSAAWVRQSGESVTGGRAASGRGRGVEQECGSRLLGHCRLHGNHQPPHPSDPVLPFRRQEPLRCGSQSLSAYSFFCAAWRGFADFTATTLRARSPQGHFQPPAWWLSHARRPLPAPRVERAAEENGPIDRLGN